MSRRVLWLILGTAAVRLVLAAGTGLGIDESYMVAAGRDWQLSYFDHPPMAWWLARAAAWAFASEAPVVVRLPFVALFAVSTWLMFVFTRRLFGERAGVCAAVALNLSPVLSVTTGSWVLPDGPLTAALLTAGYCLVRGLGTPSPRPSPVQARERGRGRTAGATSPPLPLGEGRGEGVASTWAWWLLAGLAAGLALASKYSAVLVLAGALVYLLTQPGHRAWLRRPHPYVAAAVALVCCTPVIVWNARNGWISFAFQGGRAATGALHPFGPVRTLAGEALFLGPWVWLPVMFAWSAALRNGPRLARTWLPACLGAGPVVVFVVVSLWARHVLFHWAAPGYLMLLPLLGDWATRQPTGRLRIGVRVAGGLMLAGVALLLVEARVNLLAPFGTDPGLQALDWTELGPQLAARGLLYRANTVVAGLNWHDTGKLDYALGGAAPVVCLNADARNYLFRPQIGRGQDALVIAARGMDDAAARFGSVEALPPLFVRGHRFAVFLARDFR